MIRTFLKNSTLYFISNGINKVIGLAFFAYIARLLTIEEMGRYGLLQIAMLFLSTFMTLEIQSGFTRYFFDTDQEQRRRYEFSLVNALLISNLVMGMVLFLAKPLFERALIEVSVALYVVLLLIPSSSGILKISVAKMRMQNQAVLVAGLNVAQLLVYVGVTLLLLNRGTDRVLAIYCGLLAQNVFMVICYFVNLRGWKPIMEFSLIKRSLSFSAYLAPSVLGAYVSLQIGKYLVSRIMNIESVGIYEATNRVAIIILTIMLPLYQATVPIIYEQYRQENFPQRYRLLVGIHMALLLGVVIGFGLGGREAVALVVGDKYVEFAYLVGPLAMVSVLGHITHFSGPLIHLAQKTQYVALIEIVSGVLSVGVTFALVSYQEFSGAIAAVVINSTVRYLLYLHIGNWLFPSLRVNVHGMYGYILACAGLLSIHHCLCDIHIAWRIGIGVAELALMVVIFTKHFGITREQLRNMLRRSPRPAPAKSAPAPSVSPPPAE